MKHGRRADFFFAGVAIIPLVLMLGGLPHVAALLFLPLLFIACAYGMAEQIEGRGESGEPGKGGRSAEAPHPPAFRSGSLTSRERDRPDSLS
jgi:hypothetical protein